MIKNTLKPTLVTLAFLAATSWTTAQDFATTVTASAAGSEYVMTFGFSPNATDGYDDGIDSYAPPAPPPPAFDAAFGWGGDRYYTQILAGDGDLSEHTYDISLAYASDNLITITWDNTGWSDMMSFCWLQDSFGGVMFNVDMLTATSLELTNPAFNLLKLKVTPTDYAAPVACTDYNMDQNQEGCEDDPNCCWNAALCWDLDSGECDAGPALDVFITELADPNNASSARFVELFNIGGEDIDLGSGWALQRWTNGNADPQDPVALTGTISAGGFYVISPNGTAFESMYGVEADQDIDTGGAADSNGDDNIALVDPDGNIADMYGRPGEDGTGTDHEFEDGRAERNSDIAGGNATFDPAEWAIDNDGGGGDGPQDAPDGFDPFVWFDHNGLPTGNWGCLDPEALNYDSDSDGCEDGTEDCCDYPTLATISEIQGQADASPFAGEYVETSGIVTAVASGAYWIQDGSGAWNGIYVYDATDTLVSVGDDITIVALVTEYYDLTELLDLEEFTVNSSGNALPEAVSLGTGAVNAEDYESVLVATAGTCDNADLGYGEWSIDDGSGSVVLDDMMFAFVPIDGNDYEVAGPVYYGYGAYKIQPRDENDVVGEGATATVDLTFNLDMSDVETSADGVFLAGGGTFGNPGDNPMSDEDGDDVWTITMTLPANLSTDYTFLNGNCPDWSCKESIGGQDCAVPPYNDRHIDLGEEDVTVNACFAVCGDGTCDELTPPTTYSANFSIDMNASDYPNADYPSVVINGSWNGWGAWGVELSDSDEDGVFTGTLEGLADNNTVEFVIAVTGEADGWSGWGVVFNAPIGGDCWNGNDEYANYIFTVSGADVDLAYCAGTCDATCEAPPAGDPNFSATISANGGGEDGYDLTFGFSPDATDGYDDGIDSYAPPAPPPPAFDAALTWGGDRYYTQILNGSVDDLVEHEYAIALAYDTNNLIELSWDNTGWSDLMSSCQLQDAFGGVLGIDIDMLSNTSLTLDNPAFNSLLLKVTPAAGSDEPDTFPVTFTVVDDGNNYQDVELKGSMTNWATVDMTNDGTGTWTLTLDLESGSHEWGAIENDGSEWGIWLPSFAGFDANPVVVVGPDGSISGDTGFTVPCQTCADEYDVTFQLTDAPCDGNPWVTGTMDGWSGWGAELSDGDGDGTYTASMALYASDIAYEYKYTCGGWDQVEDVPDECAYNTEWHNRGFFLTDGDIVLESHAWSGCPGDEPPAGDPNFSFDVNVSGEGNTYTMTAGFSPDATDGYDDGIDSYAPPAPPPPAFDAALGWGGDRYYTQILNGSADDLVEHVYDIILAYGTDNLITVSWDNTGWSNLMSSCMLEDSFGGAMFSVDMLTDNSLELDNPAFNLLKLKVTPLAGGGEPPPSLANLFFSEAAEGSSNNKYLEIYNGTDGDVDLGAYSLSSCSNGCDEEGVFDYPNNVTFEAGTFLSSGDVYVVCHGSASDGIQAECDYTFTYLSNGDDAFALTDTIDLSILDIIGDMGGDPGAGWDVAGVSEATKDHTLVRKDEVASGNAGDWASSAGTNEDDSEWIVAERPTADYTPVTLGWHIDSGGPNYGCNDPEALNYDPEAAGCSDDPADFSCCDYYVPPTPLTIYEIQGQADATPYVDVFVSTSGVVTGVTPNGFWMQDGAGAWNGIWVYAPELMLAIGDNVSTVGTVIEYYDLTEIMADAVEVNSSGNDLPASEEVCTGCFTEALESVLVVTTGECDNNDLGYGEWSIDDGSGPGMVDDKMYAPDTIYVGDMYQVAGPLDFAYGDFKIQPRDGNDVINLSLPGPNFSVSLDATASAGTYTMTVGFSPGATDGYDEGFDTYAPPAPPPPAFDAAIGWDNDRYFTQIVAGMASDWGAEHVFDVQLQYDTDNLITLTWDNTGWTGLGSFHLTDAFDGALGIDVDMTVENSLTLDNPAFNLLKLKVTPVDLGGPPPPGLDFAVSLDISGEGNTYTMTAGFSPNATDGYDDGIDSYAPPAPPPPAFDAALGWAGDRYYTQILAGLPEDVGVEHVFDIQLQYAADNLITLSWDNTGWAGLGSFHLTDAFDGALGIDIDMTVENSLTLDNPAFNMLKLKVTPSAPEPPPAPDFAVSLDISGEGNTYTMTAGFSPNATDGYDDGIDSYAPPAPPPPAFDAALGWAGDRYYTQILAGLPEDVGVEHVFDIQLQYAADNLITLNWDNTGWAGLGSFHLTDAFDGALGIDIDMTTANSLTLDNPAFNMLKLKVTPAEQGPPPETVDLTFNLDMSDVETSPDGVFLAGGGTFGSPGDNPMSDEDGDDIWTITVTLPSNLSTDYTFLNGNCPDWSCKENIGGQDCAVPPYNDRHIDLGEQDVTVNACFAVCGDGFCDELTPPTTYSAFISIDMNGSEYPNADYSSVVINGSWNGWGAWGLELTDPEPDGVFTGTLEGLADDNAYEFVIAVTGEADGWSGWGVVINAPLGSECDYVPTDEWANYGFYIAGADVEAIYCAGTCDEACEAPPGDGNPNFAFDINVSGEGNTYTLTAGFSPDATDGYDDGLDTYAPPAPPPPAFDAALTWSGDRYYTQILNGSVDDLVEHEYGIALAYDTDNLIELSWDNTGWSDLMSSCVLQDAFGGTMINVDMLSETSLTLDNPAFNSLLLKVTPSAPEPPPPSLDFAVALAVAGEGNTYTMTAGFSPDATDGYDDGLDTYAPPAPPPPAFDAALSWDGDRYYTQILAGHAEDAGVEHVFDVQLQYGTDNLIALTWDNTGWSDLGTFSLTDAFDGVLGIDIDMTQETSLTLDNPAFNVLKLKITPAGEAGPPPFDDISLAGGWNLISFDVGIENNAPADVFAALIDGGNLVVVTGYGAGGANFYDPTVPDFLNTLTSIDDGFGYWVKVNNEATLSAEGVSLGDGFAKDLAAGWNLIGYWLANSQGPADAFAALIDAGNLVVATGYGAGGANFYDPTVPDFLNTLTSLDNGFGYWVKVNSAVDGFTYPAAGLARPIASVPQETNPEIVKTNEFMFINGEVNFIDMDYTVGDKVEIRTESGLLVGEMKIISVTYEMLDELDDFSGFECSLGDNLLMTAPIYGDDWTTEEIDGAIKGENLRFIYNDNEAELTIEYTGTMELAKVDLEFRFIPDAYALRQNYPNPFNPVTTITYDLADAGFVSLKVYNMLGQEVINLVSADRKAGVYTVQWNGTGHTGHPVSSGVYFYVLNADQFTSVKKMVFMK
jgi:hypothetical protein